LMAGMIDRSSACCGPGARSRRRTDAAGPAGRAAPVGPAGLDRALWFKTLPPAPKVVSPRSRRTGPQLHQAPRPRADIVGPARASELQPA
jgi:hypothetical protein